jgi:hypothetical protein
MKDKDAPDAAKKSTLPNVPWSIQNSRKAHNKNLAIMSIIPLWLWISRIGRPSEPLLKPYQSRLESDGP